MMHDTFPLDRKTRYFNRERLKEEAAIGIYNLMKDQGVTRAALARRIGKGRSFMTKVLEGSHNFTLETLADIYAALGRAAHLSLGDDFQEFRVPADAPTSSAASATVVMSSPFVINVQERRPCYVSTATAADVTELLVSAG